MTNVAIQDIPAATSATADQLLGVKAGVAKLMSLSSLAVGFIASAGASPATRLLRAKVEEIEISPVDFGADITGSADSTTAFNTCIANYRRIHVPAGTFKCTSLNITRSVTMFGDGGATGISTINLTTTTTHGVIVNPGSGGTLTVSGIKFHYSGAGQPAGYHGMLIQRKVYADDIYMDNFTGDGARFASNDSAADGTGGTIGAAVFFSLFVNCWFKNNTGAGLTVRGGANANTFINCQFSANGTYGVHHFTDGFATYGNVFIAGQCSYNKLYGYYFESGTNIIASALYAEDNWTPTNSNSDGYTNGGVVDVYLGDNCSRSNIGVGTVFNNDNSHVRAPTSGLNDGTFMYVGGDRIFGSTASHTPHETSTFSALTGSETLAQVITQVNLIRTKLQTAGVVQ